MTKPSPSLLHENPTIIAKLCFLEVLVGVKRALFQKRVSCVGSGAKLLTECASIKNAEAFFVFSNDIIKNNLLYFLFTLLSCFVKKVTKEDAEGEGSSDSPLPLTPPLKTAKHAPQARGLGLYSVILFYFIILYFLCRVIFIIYLFYIQISHLNRLKQS